ncbi:DUF4153 domain-containing protein [Winogradskyella endarachnes]|uniref:DUF4173 domain-containing protein n=1 Tax=Winogradskyella endarachnes TaxID=2681965 RepID=A0A6L6UCH1_9FLAO|nr:DUF4173 domain-containing protein [Winogradskyella endarachnes]MUU79669.1 DUF4173 domain-containing protein [Winogradskyella endarachnes]
MKKLALFIAALLFSTFFYDQSIGLNLFLFSILTVVILFINNQTYFKNRKTQIYSAAYLITGLTIFFHSSTLSIIANVVSFFTLIGHLSETKSSIYINWLNGLYTTIAGFFHRNFAISETKSNEDDIEKKEPIDYLHWAKIILIPAVILITFIALYKEGNPVFSNIIEKIDFSFVNIQWLLVAGLGYYLFNNIYAPIEVEPATELDLKTENSLQKTSAFSLPKLKQENQLGVILISLLNALIVLYLITDIAFLTSDMEIRASLFSAQVHSGINALIASIVIAIMILLYVFRGNLNFYEQNKTLKRLAYTWIILNILLVISIAFKNSQYIYYFGLTYKRIGVLVYLILATIGLVTTLLKISSIKNNWYLFRVNTQAAFIILVMSSAINWDYHITNYNFKYAKSMDFKYLLNLSNNNTFILNEQLNTKALDEDDVAQIKSKYHKYIYQLRTNNWQELLYDNFKLNKK